MLKPFRFSLRFLLLIIPLICIVLAAQRFRVARWVQAERRLAAMDSCWLTYDNDYSTWMEGAFPLEAPANGPYYGFVGDCTAARVVLVSVRSEKVEEALPSLKCLPKLSSVVLVDGGETPHAELERLETLLRAELPGVKVEIQLAVVG